MRMAESKAQRRNAVLMKMYHAANRKKSEEMTYRLLAGDALNKIAKGVAPLYRGHMARKRVKELRDVNAELAALNAEPITRKEFDRHVQQVYKKIGEKANQQFSFGASHEPGMPRRSNSFSDLPVGRYGGKSRRDTMLFRPSLSSTGVGMKTPAKMPLGVGMTRSSRKTPRLQTDPSFLEGFHMSPLKFDAADTALTEEFKGFA